MPWTMLKKYRSSGDKFQRNELQKPLQSPKMDKENQEKFDKPVFFL